jgi:hypothetical protein
MEHMVPRCNAGCQLVLPEHFILRRFLHVAAIISKLIAELGACGQEKNVFSRDLFPLCAPYTLGLTARLRLGSGA